MKDFFGRELQVGDQIVYLSQGRNSSAFVMSEVVGFTPRMIRCRYSPISDSTILKVSDKVIKL